VLFTLARLAEASGAPQVNLNSVASGQYSPLQRSSISDSPVQQIA